MTTRSLAAIAALCCSTLAPGVARAFDFAPNDRLTATLEGGRFAPKRPGVAAFAPGEGHCPKHAFQEALIDELEILANTSKRPVPKTDVRLCATAEAFLGWEGKEPPTSLLAGQVLQHFGMVASFPRVVILNVPEDEPKLVAQQVFDVVGNYALNAKQARYGMMYQRLRRKLTRVSIALADAPPLELQAPRALAAGQSARITGKVTDDLDRPRLLVSDAVGKLTTVETAQGSDFAGEVKCGERPGTIRVEIRAELGGSPVLVARFPVACGRAPETAWAVAPPEPWTGDLAAQSRQMVSVINAERAAAGLPALTWDDALAGVAQGVATAIKVEVARGAFDVPRDLPERLRKVGIASPVVLQNPAQGRSVQEIMDQMAASPGHRTGYMDAQVTNVGVGAASTAEADGRTTVFLDQLFIKELPPLDVVATREKLRAAVIQKRKDGRYPAAAPEPNLDEFAQTFAKELAAAAGNLPKARQAELTKALDKQFKAVSVTFGARQDPLDFAEEPEVTAPGKHFGVGVALGMNEKLGRNAVYAVIAVGQERAGKEEAPSAPRKGKRK